MAFREGGEHGEAVAVDDVELFAIPIDVAFGQDFGEFVEVFGVLRADMGESMAALVVIGGVPGVAQIEANPSKLLAPGSLVHRLPGGEDGFHGSLCPLGVALRVLGKMGGIHGAEAVGSLGLALALVGAGVVGLGEPAIVVALVVAGGAVGGGGGLLP